ncbi:MAG TPA: ribonuclease HIII [Firmicutes bacterium]|nr:ribonuclease HIII [Bacillota bacterium]HHY98201.1 ribonuclease HIII [Bacillota bacterium]
MQRVGLDESGKGDYFGPLVVAAVCANEEIEERLKAMGVKDSKRLSDKRILELAVEIKRLCPNSVVTIGPKRYNQLYRQFRNLNRLLAWAHARALENVLEPTRCELAIADQFGDESFLLNALMEKGRQVRLEQRHRAEEETVVAAASILARAEFVEQIQELSVLAGIELPKGASNPSIISVGKSIFEKGGVPALEEVAKLHFKITDAICE